MTIRSFKSTFSKLGARAYVDDSAAVIKDRKFNRTSQINFAPHHLANPIFIVKIMTDSAFRPFPR